MKVLKIGAVWCSTCLVMRPRWKEVETKLAWLETEYFDFDQDEEKIRAYGLKEEEIPVFIFLGKNGQEVARLKGEYSVKELITRCEELKNS